MELSASGTQPAARCAGSDEDRWVRSVYRLHAAIFQGYRDWCRHVDLPERIRELELEELRKGGEAVVSGCPVGRVGSVKGVYNQGVEGDVDRWCTSFGLCHQEQACNSRECQSDLLHQNSAHVLPTLQPLRSGSTCSRSWPCTF
jgi:hypothetical protein